MFAAEIRHIVLDADTRRKLKDLAEMDVPMTWELIEDHGLFGFFSFLKRLPTREDLLQLLSRGALRQR